MADVSTIASDLLSVGYANINIGGRSVEVSVPGLDVIFDSDAAAENAQNLAVVTAFASTSPALSNLAANSPPGTQVNVIIEYGDAGEISGEMRSQSRPGFGEDSWVVKIYVNDTNYLYTTVDGGVDQFTLQHLVNHELAHAFTENAPDSPEFLALVNQINSETEAGGARNLDYEIPPIPRDSCFGPEVPIDMWPLDPTLKPGPDGIYDQDEVRAKIWKKPIELIAVGDIVVSFDDNDNLVPGPVTRTFQNNAKILLDFHGTRVTPGHVYYRPDSKKSYKYETLIDVLRDDGVIKHQDGTLIRAATNAPVDSPRDGFVRAVAGKRKADGTFVQTDEGRIRLGTRFLVGAGEERKSFAVGDLIERNGGVVGPDELIHVGYNPGVPFTWDFADTLPKPEDFVLACSGTTLEDVYKAAEWESQGPRLPAPMVLDRGPVQPLKGAALSAMPRNEPLNVSHAPVAAARPQRTLNRKQRKAMEAKQRKAAKARKQMAG